MTTHLVGAAVAALGMALTALTGPPTATTDRDPVRAEVAETMRLDGWPALLAATTDGRAAARTYSAGVSELGSSEPVPDDGRIRIGSSTKTFTAAVLLQLVDEGSIALDDPVEEHLPGVVRHPDVSGEQITVRHLLQHTSGLPDMSGDILEDLLASQHRYVSPRAALDLALAKPVSGAPGGPFQYSNANYVVAGLVVEAVAGRPLAEEVERRILEPLELDDTYFPDQGEQVIRGTHPHSYVPVADPPVDHTDLDPSWGAGAGAGAMVSTTTDLVTFYSALARGRVVPADLLAEMRRTIPASGPDVPAEGALWPGAAYGLGLVASPLSCGGVAWGHGGDVPGTTSRVAGGGRSGGRRGGDAQPGRRRRERRGAAAAARRHGDLRPGGPPVNGDDARPLVGATCLTSTARGLTLPQGHAVAWGSTESQPTQEEMDS